MNMPYFLNPWGIKEMFWPTVKLYREQRNIVESVWYNKETFVTAANQVGKDFVAAFIALAIWISAIKTGHSCRILTTSVADHHLDVLWGEISNFFNTSKIPLNAEDGGPFVFNHHEIRRAEEGKDGKCYLKGQVSKTGEGMSGHHADRTLLIGDEASGLDDKVYSQSIRWAKRIFCFGNPNPCLNFFYKSIKKGDIPSTQNDGTYFRKVLKITAQDSPNVRWAEETEIPAGIKPTNKIMVEGVLPYFEYLDRVATWGEHEIKVGIRAEFDESSDTMLFPVDWLLLSEQYDYTLGKHRVARALGIDPGEGGDKTAWVVIDKYGIIHLEAYKTPDTNVVIGRTLAIMREYNVPSENVCFDRGGGKTHADRLRSMGFNVRTVGFGESVSLDPKRGMTRVETRMDTKEDRYAYVNRRSEMYGEMSLLLEPVANSDGVMVSKFAIPKKYEELRRQLSLIPKRWNNEGRLKLLPKKKNKPDSEEECLVDIIGNSPDESDALVLAGHAMLHKRQPVRAGAVAV